MISRVVDNNFVENNDFSGFLYICDHIKAIMGKLCSQYQNPGNNNIHSILMLWMHLFGNIYSSSHYWKELLEKKEPFPMYEEVKEEILKTLKKIQI